MLVLVLVIVLPTSPRLLKLPTSHCRLGSRKLRRTGGGYVGQAVLEMVGTLRGRVLPMAWRGAALACIRRPRDICSSGASGRRMSLRAAPANNPSAMHYPWL